MAQEWIIGDRRFPSTKAVDDCCREILSRHSNRERLTGEDARLVRDLLVRHPHYRDVIGPGIDHLYVYHIPGTPWRRFEILRIDGTRRDIGYRRCLAVAPNPLREIRRVCRSLIQLQIADFRASRYRPLEGWTCEECQDLVVNSGDVHADHLAPWTFDWLVDDWLCFHALDPGRIEILGSSRYQAHSRFADQRLAEQWTDYHRLHAKLRILCVPCHKRAHRRKA